MAPVMAMGEAAGVAASIALSENIEPREIEIHQLRAELLEQSVILKPIPIDESELKNG